MSSQELSKETKKIVKATAPVLQEYGVEITTRMYERMAEEQPDLKALFANTRNGQAERLAGAVLAYAQNIDDLEELAPTIAVIAKKHVNVNLYKMTALFFCTYIHQFIFCLTHHLGYGFHLGLHDT